MSAPGPFTELVHKTLAPRVHRDATFGSTLVTISSDVSARAGHSDNHANLEGDSTIIDAPFRPEVPWRRRGDRVVLDAGEPFDWLKSLTALDFYGTHLADARLESTRLRLPVDVGTRSLVLDIAGAEPSSRAGLDVGAAGGAVLADEEISAVVRALDHATGFRDDLRGFVEIARTDVDFWRIAGTLEGLHRIGFATPFEGICWTILRQRQYPNVARARLRRLRERFGRSADSGTDAAPFPSPITLSALPIEAIRREVKSRKKARYLREAATAFAAWGDDLDVLHDPPDEIEERLRGIRGVGPWSSSTFLARAFQRPHLRQVVVDGKVVPEWRDVLERFYGPDVDPVFVRERADAYGRWESMWLYYAAFTHRAMKRAN